MFEVKEPYTGYPIAFEDNGYFNWAREKGVIVIDFKSLEGKLTPIVNGRQLQPYEWKYEECIHKISLKDWV
jgi:hypothetical protein